MEKHLKIILEEMCSRVEAKNVDFKKKDWFWEKSWSEDEQEDFRKWMVEYLMENKEARLELMRYPRKIKKNIDRFTKIFVLNFGWKTK